MKKIVLTIAFLFATTMASNARNIDVYIPGSAGGTFMQTTKFITAALNEKGINTNISVKGNCVNGLQALKQSKNPTIMIYSDEVLNEKGCDRVSKKDIDNKTVAPVMKAVAAVCTMDKSISYTSLSKGKWTVATDDSRKDMTKKFFKKLGVKIKPVMYNNSGSVTKALIGGDTQLSFTNARKAKNVLKAGGQCFFVTGDRHLKTIPTASSVTKKNVDINPTLYFFWGFNLDQQTNKEIGAAIADVVNSQEFQTFLDKKWMFPVSDQDKQNYRTVIKSAL